MSEQNAEERALYAAAVIGKDAEQFLKSDLGRTIIGMNRQDARAAMEKLKGVSPFRFWTVQALQNEIEVCEKFERHLVEVMNEGAQALQQLEQQHED